MNGIVQIVGGGGYSNIHPHGNVEWNSPNWWGLGVVHVYSPMKFFNVIIQILSNHANTVLTLLNMQL